VVRVRAGVLLLSRRCAPGLPARRFPPPQGEYYTGVGYKNVGDVAREIVDAHIDLCLDAGIELEGINAEVAKGQWEFQIFGKGSKRAADEMWIARYLLLRLCERYCVDINWHPKPLGMEYDWNGSGMHTNFSTHHMREVGGEVYFEALMSAFDEHKEAHIAVYGPDNHMRLTGLHETQAIDKFNYGGREPWRVDPHPAQLRQQRPQGLSGGPPPELDGRPVPDRRPDPHDDRDCPDRARLRPSARGRGSTGIAPSKGHGRCLTPAMSRFDTARILRPPDAHRADDPFAQADRLYGDGRRALQRVLAGSFVLPAVAG